MYAVVRSGGKQYKVSVGDLLRVEKMEGEVGERVTLDDVLMVSDGEKVEIVPTGLANAKVDARITAQGRHRKITIFKHKRRKGYRRKQGHRQDFTELAIEHIES